VLAAFIYDLIDGNGPDAAAALRQTRLGGKVGLPEFVRKSKCLTFVASYSLFQHIIILNSYQTKQSL